MESFALLLKQRQHPAEAQGRARKATVTNQPATSHPPDICLLLRAHGEQRWLISEVVPVLRQLEQPHAIPDDQRAAALAYLEVLWIDAYLRACDTDAAAEHFHTSEPGRDPVLHAKAHRYHAAVRRQRNSIARRIARLTPPSASFVLHQHASQHIGF